MIIYIYIIIERERERERERETCMEARAFMHGISGIRFGKLHLDEQALIPVSVKKQLLLPEPRPSNPSAEAASQPSFLLLACWPVRQTMVRIRVSTAPARCVSF